MLSFFVSDLIYVVNTFRLHIIQAHPGHAHAIGTLHGMHFVDLGLALSSRAIHLFQAAQQMRVLFKSNLNGLSIH